MVVEDNSIQAAIISELLHQLDSNLKLDWVTSGEVALFKLVPKSLGASKNPYELIITDIYLDGEVTGIEVWKFSQSKYPTMPSLVISTVTMRGFLDFIGPNLICPPFLQKPIRLPECRQTLEKLLYA